MKKKEFDIIIIGAGLSGLTLAKEISEKTDKNILLIEKKKKLLYDKNWCFWNTPINPFTKLCDTSWNNISIKIFESERLFSSKQIKYLHIKSSSFYNYMINFLKKKKVTFLFNKEISEIITLNDSNKIIVDKTEYVTQLLFDSRPISKNIKDTELYQHFGGYEVFFDKMILDPKKITLMDFQSFNNGLNFMYILPFSGNRALFESTYFSGKILKESMYKKDVIEYINNNFPKVKYKMKLKEKGIIPMFYNKNLNKHNYFKIGTSGNWIRASTGYCFQNSFINAKFIADKISKNKKIKIKKNIFLDFLDEIFCNLILTKSENLKQIFLNFYFKNNLKLIVSFLTGNIKFSQLLKIIFSLPKIGLTISMFQVIRKKILS